MHGQLGAVVPAVTILPAALVEASVVFQLALRQELLGKKALATGLRPGALCHPIPKEGWEGVT